MASTLLSPINGRLLSSPSSSFPARHRFATILKWQWKRDQDASLVSSRTRGQALQILANSNVCIKSGHICAAYIYGLDRLESGVI